MLFQEVLNLMSPKFIELYLKLPYAIQSKIMIYYLSYGTVASHAIRDENGNGKCTDSELTIWRTRIDKKYESGKKYLLRESIGFTQMDVLSDMRLAITFNNVDLRIYETYIKKTLKEMTKIRLLKLIQEERKIGLNT
jgi:hypothetical protein